MDGEGAEGLLGVSEQGGDQESMVTVRRFLSHIEAQMAMGLLETSGVECFLVGEHANSLLGPAFRARLQVHRREEGLARELLASVMTEGEVRAAEEEFE